jgi:hypothetical protein
MLRCESVEDNLKVVGMRKALLTTIASAAVGAVTSAAANTIDIGYSLSADAALTQIASASTPGSAVYFTPAPDSYKSNIISGSDFFPLDLGATSSDTAKGGTKPIYLYISETRITYGASKLTFTIGLGEGPLATGRSVTESVFTDALDTAYGKTTTLASATFGAGGGSSLVTVTSPVPSGTPFSVTEEIAITPGSANGNDLSTVSVTPIPETSTWAMLTLGFAGLGYAAFRRRPKPRIAGESI